MVRVKKISPHIFQNMRHYDLNAASEFWENMRFQIFLLEIFKILVLI